MKVLPKNERIPVEDCRPLGERSLGKARVPKNEVELQTSGREDSLGHFGNESFAESVGCRDLPLKDGYESLCHISCSVRKMTRFATIASSAVLEELGEFMIVGGTSSPITFTPAD
jgi:hypothetical protein